MIPAKHMMRIRRLLLNWCRLLRTVSHLKTLQILVTIKDLKIWIIKYIMVCKGDNKVGQQILSRWRQTNRFKKKHKTTEVLKSLKRSTSTSQLLNSMTVRRDSGLQALWEQVKRYLILQIVQRTSRLFSLHLLEEIHQFSALLTATWLTMNQVRCRILHPQQWMAILLMNTQTLLEAWV